MTFTNGGTTTPTIGLGGMLRLAASLEASRRMAEEKFNLASADDPCPLCGHTMWSSYAEIYVCKHRHEAVMMLVPPASRQDTMCVSALFGGGVRIIIESNPQGG